MADSAGRREKAMTVVFFAPAGMRRFMRLGMAGLAVAAMLSLSTSAMAANAALSIEANTAFLAANAHKPGVRVTRDGLQYRILKAGFGKSPKPGDKVTIYYTLSLIDGDSVQGTEQDFPAQFSVNDLIPGWQEAMKMMRVGDHWQLIVPAELGYGPRGTADGSIPPNQTLIFDVQLMDVTTPPPPPKKDDDQGGGQSGN
jgi:FKBP-type peptidyl-prolyl cis-trans isomerase